MSQFTVHAAKTNLSKLIEAAILGEDVVIARGAKPVVRLVPIQPKKFQMGIWKDMLGETPDFLEPMSQEELAL